MTIIVKLDKECKQGDKLTLLRDRRCSPRKHIRLPFIGYALKDSELIDNEYQVEVIVNLRRIK
jgi:hypothetical protein